ncbi:Pre-mRNA splicing factor PRP21 like protein-domain-containing protein [Syncephalis fuscata]|nr:Pre-mRNA splicing factor PRP21 like protein-domain-containing protein [Syncephalis fuscata]
MSAQLDIITTGSAEIPTIGRGSSSNGKPTTGLVLPPPEIRSIVDKTATFVARNGLQFEERIRDNERSNPKFCFLRPDDPYHPYYQHCIEEIQAGRELKPESVAGGSGATGDDVDRAQETAAKRRAPPKEPAAYQFSAIIPTLSAQDLDIIKLTAQFVARNGRQFVNSLAQREQRNYQFDFLRPSHSLFPYFNQLVEQYSKVLMPSSSLQKHVDEFANNKHQLMNRVMERVSYAAYVEAERKKAEDEAEKERVAFLSIDWHDFVVVETIEFTEADEESNLPMPLNLRDLENMTLEQRRLAAMIPTVSKHDDENNGDDGMDVEEDMVESDAEDMAQPTMPATQKKPDMSAKMKIVKDYNPKARLAAGGPKVNEPTQICQLCRKAIPVSEIEEHVRIELLDPRWKEQKQAAEAKNRESNLQMEGSEINKYLKNISGYRSDIFGTDEVGIGQKVMQDRERLKAAEKQKVIWDGHSGSIPAVNERAAIGMSIDEQMAAIQRNKMMVEETNRIGPHGGNYGNPGTMVNTMPPPPPPTAPGHGMPGAPYGYSQGPPMSYGNMPPPPPPSVPHGAMPPMPPPPPMPSGMMHHMSPHMPQSTLHTNDYMNGRPAEEAQHEEEPTNKKIRVEGKFIPAEEWMNTHESPITITLQAVNMPEKSDGKLTGQSHKLQNID